MAVSIAENVRVNASTIETQRITEFVAEPGRRGSKVEVKVGSAAKETVWHVTDGAHASHATVFYTQATKKGSTDYTIVGVGQHAGSVKGKTTYSALWVGKKDHRVTVTLV